MITIRVVEQMFVFDSKFWSGRIQDRTRKRQSQDKTGLTPVNTGKVTWPRRLARTKWHRRRERLWRQLRRECWRDTGGAHQWGGGNHRGGKNKAGQGQVAGSGQDRQDKSQKQQRTVQWQTGALVTDISRLFAVTVWPTKGWNLLLFNVLWRANCLSPIIDGVSVNACCSFCKCVPVMDTVQGVAFTQMMAGIETGRKERN